jgi:hypothetical protein
MITSPTRPHKLPNLPLIAILSCLILISSSAWGLTEERKHTLGALGGVYSIGGISNSVGADGTGYSGIGSLSLEYNYHVKPSYYFSFSYNATVPLMDMTLSAIMWGMEIGAHYCIFNCTTDYEQWSDTISLISYNRWGWDVGGGVSQRLLNLIQSTRDYSGLYVRTQIYYFFSSRWKLVTGFKMAQMARGDAATLTLMELVSGMAYDF